LTVGDFSVRTLVVMPIWVPLAETMMIRRYKPLWNQHITGFGIHHPGGGRLGQEVSDWDSLHPGRSFTKKLKQKQAIPASRLEQLKELIARSISEVSR
jgi:hypothetical protein